MNAMPGSTMGQLLNEAAAQALRAEAAIEPDAPVASEVTKETQIIAIYGKGGIGKSSRSRTSPT